MSWLGWTVYLLVATALVLNFTKSVLEGMDGVAGSVESSDKAMALLVGILMSAVWPVSYFARMVYRLLRKTDYLTTERQKRERAEAELRAAKEMAREAGLPWPERKP